MQGKECDLIRVFQNLISNAVKYRSKSAIEIEINAERLGPDWVIRVHDNGIGVPKEHHRRVFTRVHDRTMKTRSPALVSVWPSGRSLKNWAGQSGWSPSQESVRHFALQLPPTSSNRRLQLHRNRFTPLLTRRPRLTDVLPSNDGRTSADLHATRRDVLAQYKSCWWLGTAGRQ